MSHAVSPMENPLQIKFTRKAIARVMTELSKEEIHQNNKDGKKFKKRKNRCCY